MRSAFLAAVALAASAQTLVIENVTAVDAEGSRPHVNVVIERGTIVAAAPGAKAAGAATRVNGKGKFLIPALWDMHVHLWDKQPMLNLYVAAGVLGIRDMGSDIKRTRALRTEVAAGRLPGPALIYTSGSPIDGGDSSVSLALKAGDPEAGRQAVDQVDEGLADFVKVMSEISEDTYLSIAQRARVRRIPFAGHLPEEVDASTAVDARQRSIEHLYGMALSCSLEGTTLRRRRLEAAAKKDYAALHQIRDRTYATYNSGIATELFRRMARFGVWQTPTLKLRQRLSLLGLEEALNAAELKYVPEAVKQGWTDPRVEAQKATAQQRVAFQEDYDFHKRLVGNMYRAGTGILAGTDTGEPYVVPGFALHDELRLLVDAGLTPIDAIATATLQPARYFNVEDRQGTIARGKAANLVLLDADPAADIANTRRISAVVAKGRLLSRSCLDRLMQQTDAACATVADVTAPALKPPASKKPRRPVRPRR